MKQAEWNNITWRTNGNQMAHLKSFKISQKLKTEEQENETTGNKTIIKSLEPEVLNISYSTSFAVGVDPRSEFEMLKKCTGMQDLFILGGKKVSKNKYNSSTETLALKNGEWKSDKKVAGKIGGVVKYSK